MVFVCIFVSCQCVTQPMNAIRTILYSLKRVKSGHSILSIELTAFIVAETHTGITIKFPHSEKAVTLDKYEWVNKEKIFDDGKVFFLVANKQLNTKFATSILARYAMDKLFDTIETIYRTEPENAEDRIETLFSFRQTLKNLISSNVTYQLAS